MIKALYLVDNSSLEEKGFLFVLEKLLKMNDCVFLVDNSIMKELERLNLNDEDKCLRVSTIMSLLKRRHICQMVDTNCFADEESIQRLIGNFSGEVNVISQRISLFDLFKKMIKANDQITMSFYTIESNALVPIKNNTQNGKPFFCKNDDFYINKINTNDLKYVFSPKFGVLKLFEKGKRCGGEGTCYLTYNNLYCKIFNEKHLTYVNYEKIKYMLSLNINNRFLAWPKDLIYYDGDFVGYVMDFVLGASSLTDLKCEGFVKYSKPVSRAMICLNLLKNIDFLHKHGIVIADLKDDNVLVRNPNEVFIIDCGSFQVADYACDVITRGWTEKAYKDGELEQKLRTIDDDYYAIYRIIFELMMLKNPFYSPNNLEIDTSGEEERKFSFPLDISNINKGSPQYLKYWAILSDNMRKYFYYFFKDKNNRRTVGLNEWIQEFETLINNWSNDRGGN